VEAKKKVFFYLTQTNDMKRDLSQKDVKRDLSKKDVKRDLSKK
jgi:hypothetical protein